MKLIDVKCPRCNARIEIDPTADSAKCIYCGAISAFRKQGKPEESSTTLISASLRNTALAILLAIVAILVVGTIAGLSIFGQKPAATNQVPANPPYNTGHLAQSPLSPPKQKEIAIPKAIPKPKTLLKIEPTRVILRDIDENGETEIIASITLRTGTEQTSHFAVFDSKSGAIKAKTPPIQKREELLAAVFGNRLLLANRIGEISAYDLKTGDLQWNSSLGERISSLCAPKSAENAIAQTDTRRLSLDLITGRQTETRGACISPPVTFSHDFGDPRDRRDKSAPLNIEAFRCGSARVIGSASYTVADACLSRTGINTESMGMVSHQIWRAEKDWLVFGVRTPGAYVPMVGRLSHRRFVWKTEVPEKNPLAAMEGGPRHAAIAAENVVVDYREKQGRSFLTAFNLVDGKRSFTVELPDRFDPRTLSGSPKAIVAQGEESLLVLDPNTGATRLVIGGEIDL